MRLHTKIYMRALGYDITDFIPSELSGLKAIDLHHIVNRENRIENLMALTREEHTKYGEIKDKMCYLLNEHRLFLDVNGVNFDNDWFEEQLNKYSIYDNNH